MIICVLSFLKKYLLRSSVHVLIWLLVFWYLFVWAVCIHCICVIYNEILTLIIVLIWILITCLLVAQLCPTLWDPIHCSLPGSSVDGILRARILEKVAIPFAGDLYRLNHQGNNTMNQAKYIFIHFNILYIFFCNLMTYFDYLKNWVYWFKEILYVNEISSIWVWAFRCFSGKESTCQCRRCGFDS